MQQIDASTLSLILLTGFLASLGSTWLVRLGALRMGFVNVPRADRWSRRRVALMGGVGIAAGFYATVLLGLLWIDPAAAWSWFARTEVVALHIGAVLMAGVGLVDDLFTIKPSTKMIGEIACASILMAGGLRLNWTGYELLDVLLSFFWVIGITNAFNLLDNMDGLSAGTCAIAALFYGGLFLIHGETAPAALALALAGAALGFLVFNVNPASIFMGDVGSLFIGFLVSGITLIDSAAERKDLFAVVFVPALLLAIPIFDTSLVTVMRKLSGRAVSQGGRDHSSHRLVALGLSERRAVLLLWGLSAAAGCIGVLASVRQLPIGKLLLPAFGLFLLLLFVYLARVKVYEESEAREAGFAGRITPLIDDLMYKRRILEVALDLVLAGFAYYTSYMLRFEQSPLDANLETFTKSLPIVVACTMVSFFTFGVYRGVWRYTSFSDLVTYVKAVGGAIVLSLLVLLALYRFDGYSRSLFVIYGGILFLALGGSRASFRLLDTFIRGTAREGRGVIIYGAGDGGQFVLRELMNNEDLGLAPIGFVDDDRSKHHRKIHGVPILGDLSALGPFVGKKEVAVVLISSSKIPDDRLAALYELCGKHSLEVRRLRMQIEVVEVPAPRSRVAGA
jgi:UDP-GlcNAc:undecaprenyl-phosphate GlcNAc-1-phosphate transferase